MPFCVQNNQMPSLSSPQSGAQRGANWPHPQFPLCWEGPLLSKPGCLHPKIGISTRAYNTAGGLK